MTNEKTLLEVLAEVSAKQEFIITLTEVIKELTEIALENDFKTRGNGIEDKMFSIGYELNKVGTHIEVLNNMISSLDREMNDLVNKAMKMAMAKV